MTKFALVKKFSVLNRGGDVFIVLVEFFQQCCMFENSNNKIFILLKLLLAVLLNNEPLGQGLLLFLLGWTTCINCRLWSQMEILNWMWDLKQSGYSKRFLNPQQRKLIQVKWMLNLRYLWQCVPRLAPVELGCEHTWCTHYTAVSMLYLHSGRVQLSVTNSSLSTACFFGSLVER